MYTASGCRVCALSFMSSSAPNPAKQRPMRFNFTSSRVRNFPTRENWLRGEFGLGTLRMPCEMS
jgi:hypothetical protein